MKTERIYKYDNLKFILIFCVVLGHFGNFLGKRGNSIESMQFFVYLFHMPAFVFVTGLFSKKLVEKKQWGRALSYLIIYILMETMAYFTDVSIKGFENTESELLRQRGVPWFALSVCCWYLIAILIKRINKYTVLTIAVIVGILIGYDNSFSEYLVIKRTLVFFPFFYAGFLVNADSLMKKLDKWYLKIISAILLLTALIVSFVFIKELKNWHDLFRGSIAYSEIKPLKDMSLSWIYRILTYLIAVVLILAVICLIPNKKLPFTWIGRKTLPIYVFHYYILKLLVKLCPGFKEFILDGFMLTKLIGISLILILLLCLPIFSKIINFILKITVINNKQGT